MCIAGKDGDLVEFVDKRARLDGNLRNLTFEILIPLLPLTSTLDVTLTCKTQQGAESILGSFTRTMSIKYISQKVAQQVSPSACVS